MSCLQAIEGEDTDNPFICLIMNLLWSLSDKGTRVRFCWLPSQCGIEGNEKVDQLAKDTLDQDIGQMASVHYTDMKPLVNSYIQKLVQTKWDVSVHGRYLYLVKPTLGPPRKFQHLTRAQEVVITRLRIAHTKATKSHTLSRGPPNGCHHCGQTLTIDYLTTYHMLLECEKTWKTHLQQAANAIQGWATGNVFENSTRRPSISFEWLHTWSRVGTETHSWCCTGALFAPSWTMLCYVWHSIEHQHATTGQHPQHWIKLLGTFCTSPVSSLYAETNEADL